MWVVIWIPLLVEFLQSPTASGAILNSVFMAGSMISPHDVLAISAPDEWKVMTASKQNYGAVAVLMVLIGLREAPWEKDDSQGAIPS